MFSRFQKITHTGLNIMRAKKLYAVRVGRVPGIYETWNEARAQVEKFSGAQYKSFSTQVEADSFISGEDSTQNIVTKETTVKDLPTTKKRKIIDDDNDQIKAKKEDKTTSDQQELQYTYTNYLDDSIPDEALNAIEMKPDEDDPADKKCNFYFYV
jgi:viroplasmin and RNaseH domain-containing protein